jgi:hypothetical protein
MPIFRVPMAGKVGLNQDLSAHDLPPQAWSDALNARFLDGMAFQFLGHGDVYSGAPIIPYHLMQVNVGSARYWMYAGASKIYVVSAASGSTVHTNVTRQSGGNDVDMAGSPNQWTSTSLAGIPIFNPGNTTIKPHSWDLNVANRTTELANWPANFFCKALRAYKNQLVALNLTKSGTNYPFALRWSHPADPGAVPGSWDITDATKDAGEVDLAEGGDPIQDGLQLGGTFIVYKEQSVWRMDYAGGAFVQQFSKVMGTSGAMNRNCIAEIDGFHAVLTGSDVIVHDGQAPRSVLDKQMRRSLFRMIDATNYTRAFVFKNPFVNEVFVCFPQAGSTVPDMALVWNYRDNTASFREIPDLHHANYGPVESGLAQPWSADGGTWASDSTTWGGAEFTPDSARVLMASNEQKLFLLDSSTDFDTTAPTSFLERKGMSLGLPERMKFVRAIRPRIYGPAGETLVIRVGSADDPYEAPTYGDGVTFTIGSTVTVDVAHTGRYIALRIENTGGAAEWRLDSYDIEFEDAGEY